jgi:hypothetical protein
MVGAGYPHWRRWRSLTAYRFGDHACKAGTRNAEHNGFGMLLWISLMDVIGPWTGPLDIDRCFFGPRSREQGCMPRSTVAPPACSVSTYVPQQAILPRLFTLLSYFHYTAKRLCQTHQHCWRSVQSRTLLCNMFNSQNTSPFRMVAD